MPIFVDGVWWGFIGFDDCVTERTWSAAELDALRTASSLLAAAVHRELSDLVLREHEEKLRAVFDTALDAIFITDDERRYVDVNPAGCEYLGVPKHELIGRKIDEFLPPHKLATVEADWAEYIAGGPMLAEWETQRSDGAVRVAEASARPHFLPGLHIAFFRDVTERKRLEADLLSAQKLESLGRLAGGVAHDFNNLLTGITGYATLLLERANGDGELRRDLGEIVRAADRAAELTKQLLAFGRRQVLKPRPLDLNTVVADVEPLVQRLVGEDVELEIRSGSGLGTVRADPGQIEQVIVNLAVNARDAMPDGGRLTIETRNAGDGLVELVFSDTGLGMDEDTVGQIFEPFFTTREQGVGLGLASVYGIVRQSSGDVAVTSSPGAGTVFVITLPRVSEPPGAVDPIPEPATKPGSETILLVEDEDVVRDLTRRVLERQGYTVLACADGAAAVATAEAESRPIDLLLTDVVMPGMRGYEVAQARRRLAPEDPDPLHVGLRRGDARRPAGALGARADREAVRRRRPHPARPRSTRLLERRLECPHHAGVAQLVEHQLPKLRVVGSSPIARFSSPLGGFRSLRGSESRRRRGPGNGRHECVAGEPIQTAFRAPRLLELVTRAALAARVQAVSDQPYEFTLIP